MNASERAQVMRELPDRLAACNGTDRPKQWDDAVSRRLVWSLLFGVAVSLAALIASRDQDAITNLLRHDVGSLALKIMLLVFFGGLILTLFPRAPIERHRGNAVLGRRRPTACRRLQLPLRVTRGC